jgi:hypothetical protein
MANTRLPVMSGLKGKGRVTIMIVKMGAGGGGEGDGDIWLVTSQFRTSLPPPQVGYLT